MGYIPRYARLPADRRFREEAAAAASPLQGPPAGPLDPSIRLLGEDRGLLLSPSYVLYGRR